MNLGNSLASEQSTEAETTNDSSIEDIPFEANEGTEGYFLFSEGSSIVTKLTEDIFGYDRVTQFVEWGDTLETLEEAGGFEAYCDGEELAEQQKLNLLWILAKGTFGKVQGQKNEGYGMGWNSDHTPPSIYDNEAVDHVPYLDVYSDLPAFDHTTLTESEIEELESNGLDMDNFGSLDRTEGPALPVINGERLPLIVEEGDEVNRMISLLDNIDPDEITFCEKGGELQGTPTLGPSESTDSEKVGSDSEESNPSLAEKPEKVQDLFIPGVEEEIEEIESERTLETILRVEEEGKNRKGAKEAIEVRLESLDSDDEETKEESETSPEGDEEWTEADKNLMSTLIESGRVDSVEEAKEQLRAL